MIWKDEGDNEVSNKDHIKSLSDFYPGGSSRF